MPRQPPAHEGRAARRPAPARATRLPEFHKQAAEHGAGRQRQPGAHRPHPDRRGQLARIDWPGAALATAAVAALAFAIIEGPGHGWASPVILAGFGSGAAALAWFIVGERRRAEPLVDVSLFRSPAFTAANAAALAVFFAFVGAIVYLSAYLQQVQGRSPVAAGAEVSVIGAAFALAAPVSGRVTGRTGARAPMVAGLLLAGAAALGLLRLGPGTGPGAIWWNFALLGGGAGLCLTPMTVTAVAAVAAARAGMAAAIHNAIRQLGQVLGVAVLGALAYARLPGAESTGRPLDPAQRLLFVDVLRNALRYPGWRCCWRRRWPRCWSHPAPRAASAGAVPGRTGTRVRTPLREAVAPVTAAVTPRSPAPRPHNRLDARTAPVGSAYRRALCRSGDRRAQRGPAGSRAASGTDDYQSLRRVRGRRRGREGRARV
jgi:Major Facilitator Superfamily